MQVEPSTLTRRTHSVSPLEPKPTADLAARIDLESMRERLDQPATRDLRDGETSCARRLQDSGRLAFAIIALARARSAMNISHGDILAEHRGTVIAHTGIARESEGANVRTQTKYRPWRLATRVLGCVRVQLDMNARSEHRIRATGELGCTRGELRRLHPIHPDGAVRDMATLSVVDTQRPAVGKERVTRLGYRP